MRHRRNTVSLTLRHRHLEEKRISERLQRSLFAAGWDGAARAQDVRHGPARVFEDKPGGCLLAGRREIPRDLRDAAVRLLLLLLQLIRLLVQLRDSVIRLLLHLLQLIRLLSHRPDFGQEPFQPIGWNARRLPRIRSVGGEPNPCRSVPVSLWKGRGLSVLFPRLTGGVRPRQKVRARRVS